MNTPTHVIYFEDDGQDFLRWYVDAEGVVVDSQPFQASTWCGTKITNMRRLISGQETVLLCISPHLAGIRNLIHRVEKVEAVDDDELPPCIGEAMRDTTHGIQHRAANPED